MEKVKDFFAVLYRAYTRKVVSNWILYLTLMLDVVCVIVLFSGNATALAKILLMFAAVFMNVIMVDEQKDYEEFERIMEETLRNGGFDDDDGDERDPF